MVHGSLCAGHLEGDSHLYRERGPALGTVLPSDEYHGSVYNFSLANLIAGIKSTQFVNAPPGLTFPGDPGFIGQDGREQPVESVGAPRGARLGPQGRRQDGDPRFLGNLLRLHRRRVDGERGRRPALWRHRDLGRAQFSNPCGRHVPGIPAEISSPMSANKNAPFARDGIYIATSTQPEDDLSRTSGT